MGSAPALGADLAIPSASRAPTIDGVLAPGEWQGARVEPLSRGGELYLIEADDSLYAAVRSEDPGIAHLCLASAEGITVLHASAALGVARYVAQDSGWRLRDGFTWELRNTPTGGSPTAEELDAYFAQHDWVANPASSGVGIREFRIGTPTEFQTLAAAHLDLASQRVFIAGTTASDGCGDFDLVRGAPPPTLAFDPARWLRIEHPGSVRPPDEIREPNAELRRSFDLGVPVSPTPVVITGTPQLFYELHLTSFAQEPLVVRRVEVLDAEDGTIIAELREDALDSRLERPGATDADGARRAIAPGMFAVLYLELPLADGVSPRTMEHRITYHADDEDPAQPPVVQGGRVAVRHEPPVALAPPLRGGPWVAIYHPSWERGHRRYLYAVDGRARIPGRFAVDWVLLDAQGRRARDDADTVANWYGYRADVLAVADGVVAAARDDVTESATLSDHPQHPLADATGNYVALDLGDGRYAFYEHLAPGSVRVEPGERVKRGQVIGAVGFTGHSMGPHLHFHVADANSPLGAEGLPFVLDAFRVLGSYDGFDALENVPWTPRDDAGTSLRTGELPAPNVVVDFATSVRPTEEISP